MREGGVLIMNWFYNLAVIINSYHRDKYVIMALIYDPTPIS